MVSWRNACVGDEQHTWFNVSMKCRGGEDARKKSAIQTGTPRFKLFGLMWVLMAALSCTQRSNDPIGVPRLDNTWLSDVTTSELVDIGEVHNAAMEKLRKRAVLPMGIPYDEYIRQVQKCFNRALEPYEPSRSITLAECEQAVQLLGTEVQPYFDLTLRDPAYLDPLVPLNRWLERGLITPAEHAELTQLLAGQLVPPSTESVAIAQSVFMASDAYWSSVDRGKAAYAEDEPLGKKEVSIRAADTLGGIISHLLGGGPIATGLISFAASTIVDMGGTGSGGATSDSHSGITGYGCGWCSIQ
jgi:hypothetical protein